jgi:hypothetical protein
MTRSRTFQTLRQFTGVLARCAYRCSHDLRTGRRGVCRISTGRISALEPTTDSRRTSRHVRKVPTGDIGMKEVAIECANYVFFLPPTLAMMASRVIGQPG